MSKGVVLTRLKIFDSSDDRLVPLRGDRMWADTIFDYLLNDERLSRATVYLSKIRH